MYYESASWRSRASTLHYPRLFSSPHCAGQCSLVAALFSGQQAPASPSRPSPLKRQSLGPSHLAMLILARLHPAWEALISSTSSCAEGGTTAALACCARGVREGATATGEVKPADGGRGREAGTPARSGFLCGRGRLENLVCCVWPTFSASPPCGHEGAYWFSSARRIWGSRSEFWSRSSLILNFIRSKKNALRVVKGNQERHG